VRLSQRVYQGSSLAAAASAAKVTSIASQHKERLPLVTWRLALAPMISIAGMLWTPLALFALILVQPLLIDLAIYLAGVILVYEVVVILSLRDADRRAVEQLRQLKAVSEDQIPKVQELLDAASKTYVASALTGGLASMILLLCRIRFEENS
jgi:Zn-dependent membrane protease YugP